MDSPRHSTITTIKTHTVPSQITSIRLQEYGVGIFDYCKTKSAFKKALKKKWVSVNGVIASSATYLKGGEIISLSIPEPTVPTKKLILPLQVLFEDEYLAIINKPAGIVVSGNTFKTIANALSQNLHPSTLADAAQPQPIHRLDYPTTGALLVGKTSSSIRILNALFEDKKVQKTYIAVTIAKMQHKGVIDVDIDGKQSISNYRVLDSVTSERFGTLNLVQLNPITGRRHQLRKHLARIGNPILGDAQYGTAPTILKGKGLYLHAFSLAFEHPFKHKKMKIQCKLSKKYFKLFPKATPM